MKASTKRARAEANREAAEQRSADEATLERKYVRASNEDDDRSRIVNGQREYANKLYLTTHRFSGWHPAINIRLRDMAEVYEHAPDFPGFAGHAGFFYVILRRQGATWRISCWGGDDTGYERIGLTEEKARKIYEGIRDFTTIRTLYRRGFRPI